MQAAQISSLFVERLSTLPEFIIKDTASDLIKGIVQTALFTPLSIVTLGLSKDINANAGVTPGTNWLNKVTPNLLNHVLWTLNDKADSVNEPSNRFYALEINNKNFLTKHVFSRFMGLGHLIFVVALKVIALVPASFALLAMIATRGQYEKINSFAIQLFNPLGIISDVCQGVRYIINPFQFQQRNSLNDQKASYQNEQGNTYAEKDSWSTNKPYVQSEQDNNYAGNKSSSTNKSYVQTPAYEHKWNNNNNMN